MSAPVKRALLLLYHHVGTPPPAFQKRKLWVTPALLQLHVRYLRARGYRFTTVSEALAAPSGRLACATFDDGFRDVVEAGFPVLRALGVPGTLLVPTAEVGGRAVAFPEETGTGPADLASWEELRALRAAGWEIGSHSHTHARLAGTPPGAQEALLRASRDALARELGEPPRVIAYPYGSYDAATLAAARALGFQAGLTTHRGLVRDGDDPLQLVRVTMGGQRCRHALRLAKLVLVELGVLPLRRPRLLGPG